MSNLPKGNDLNSKWKVQNVITGIILREYTPFSAEDIYDKVEKWCEGSPCAKDGVKRQTFDLPKMIRKTLNTLLVIGAVKYDRKTKTYELDIGFPGV